jgi:hypothetical protein
VCFFIKLLLLLLLIAMFQVHAVGEMMLEVGAPHGWGPQRLSAAQLQDVLDRLTVAAQEGSADVTLLRQGTAEVQAGGEGPNVQQDSLAAGAYAWQCHAGTVCHLAVLSEQACMHDVHVMAVRAGQ